MPPPPAAQADYVTPQPTPSAVWVAGYYNFDGYHYYWVPGHWEIPPPNVTVFVRPHWVYRGGAVRLRPRLLALTGRLAAGLNSATAAASAALVGGDQPVPRGAGLGVDLPAGGFGVEPGDGPRDPLPVAGGGGEVGHEAPDL